MSHHTSLSRRHAAARLLSYLVAAILIVPGGAAAQAPAGPPPGASETPAGTFVINALVQADLVVRPENASFLVPNSRLLVGARLTPETRLFTHFNFSRTSQVLLDARISHAVSERLDLDAGLYMAPFSREVLTFIGDLPLPRRARMIRRLAPFRQIGAGFTYEIVPGALQARGGVFNGNGGLIRANDNKSFMYVGRVEGVSTSALTRLDLGASVAISRDESLGIFAEGPGRRLLLGADAVLDMPRFYLIGEMLFSSFAPDTGADVSPYGAMGRIGFRATPEQSFVLGIDFFESDGTTSDEVPLRLAIAYSHWFGRYLRVLAGYDFDPEQIDTGDLTLRMQVVRM